MNALMQAALDYADRGWPVFPCKPNGKLPITPNGFKDATADPTRIERWWARHPHCNIGLATGGDFDVWDIDDATDLSPDALHYIADSVSPSVVTGKGGLHIYVHPSGMGLRTRFYGDTDWRGRGGYVIAPPSIHENGHRYEWMAGLGPDTKIPAAPAWLLKALVGRKSDTMPDFKVTARHLAKSHGATLDGGPLAGLVRTVLAATEGRRNDTLNWAAYKLGEHIAHGRVEAIAGTSALIEAGVRAGLAPTEVEATVQSGVSKWA